MIKASIYTKKIDYNTLVELLMPYMEKWFSAQKNVAGNLISKVISNNGKPTGFSKFLVSVLPNKSGIAASMFPHFDESLKEYLNNLMEKNGVVAKITSIKMDTLERSRESMLKIEISLDEINYEKTLENLMPQFLQTLSQKDDKPGKLVKLFLSYQGLPDNMIKAMIGAIPPEQRDDLVAAILTEYKQELADSLNTLIEKNNIKAEVSEVNIDRV